MILIQSFKDLNPSLLIPYANEKAFGFVGEIKTVVTATVFNMRASAIWFHSFNAILMNKIWFRRNYAYLSTQPRKGICSLGCSYSLCLTSRLDKTFISNQKPCVKNFFHHFQKFLVEEVGLEPTKPFQAADLQSAAIATMRPFH